MEPCYTHAHDSFALSRQSTFIGIWALEESLVIGAPLKQAVVKARLFTRCLPQILHECINLGGSQKSLSTCPGSGTNPGCIAHLSTKAACCQDISGFKA